MGGLSKETEAGTTKGTGKSGGGGAGSGGPGGSFGSRGVGGGGGDALASSGTADAAASGGGGGSGSANKSLVEVSFSLSRARVFSIRCWTRAVDAPVSRMMPWRLHGGIGMLLGDAWLECTTCLGTCVNTLDGSVPASYFDLCRRQQCQQDNMWR